MATTVVVATQCLGLLIRKVTFTVPVKVTVKVQHFNIALIVMGRMGLELITARKRSLGQFDVFTHVCHSVHGGGFSVRGEGLCPGGLCPRGSLCQEHPHDKERARGTHATGMNAFLFSF